MGSLSIRNGEWPTDYYSFGVRLEANGLMRTNIYEDDARQGQYDRNLMHYTPGKWYRLVMRASHSSDAPWTVTIWEEGGPSRRWRDRVDKSRRPEPHVELSARRRRSP